MRGKTDQKNPEYGHFSRSVFLVRFSRFLRRNCPKSIFFGLYFPSVDVNVKNKYLYSVRMRENADQKNSELGYLPCSGGVSFRRKSLSEIDGWV